MKNSSHKSLITSMKWSSSCPKLQRKSCLLFCSIQVQLMHLNPWNWEIWKPFFFIFQDFKFRHVIWSWFCGSPSHGKTLGYHHPVKKCSLSKTCVLEVTIFASNWFFLFFSLGDRGKHKPGYIHQFCWHWCNGEPAIDFHRHWEQNSDDRLLGRAFFVNKLKFQKLQKRLAGSHIWK